MTDLSKIRNFSIIAHIDHGKSTLADRLLEVTNTISKREMTDRVLDTLELEQEKGITIKLQTARMQYKDYILNLIDTPGHVDFSYEVSRSLSASEGALLLVDATQGIQAQTFSTVYKALERDLEIIPVINKIDLPSAEVEKTAREIVTNFGFAEKDILRASGKSGIGITEILDAIIEKIPAPLAPVDNTLRALIFDSFYHEHKGVVVLVKVVSGEVKANAPLYFLNSKVGLTPIEVGYLRPMMQSQTAIGTGEVGYIATGLKDIRTIHKGDTITFAEFKDAAPLAGYVAPKPVVFASIYPVEADDFPEFQEGIGKLALNDAALTFTKESSQALGSGFNCGFLGLLHLEVTIERLEREFGLSLVTTVPSVQYLLKLTTTDVSKLADPGRSKFDPEGRLIVQSAGDFPDQSLIVNVSEPWSKLEVMAPEKHIGGIMELCDKHRGIYEKLEYLSEQYIAGQRHVVLKYEVPTAEIMTDFFDKLKSITQGYASMDYEEMGYRLGDVVKVSILINYEPVDAFSFLAHRDAAEARGKRLVSKLVDLIPKQQFKIPIQAAIGSNVIARETIQAYRKDVTANLSGGDVSRKMKLLNKQKKGKERLKKFGKVEVPKEAFLSALTN